MTTLDRCIFCGVLSLLIASLLVGVLVAVVFLPALTNSSPNESSSVRFRRTKPMFVGVGLFFHNLLRGQRKGPRFAIVGFTKFRTRTPNVFGPL